MQSDDDAVRREALASFLRTRRARLTPAEVGLATGRRRRTPGLRREEVADMAHVGIAWYTALEQGRPVRPSEDVLRSLANALRLTHDERCHLFLLGGQAPPATQPSSDVVSPALQTILGSLTYPAYVLGGSWDYLAWNEAADELFSLSQGQPPYERNLIWQLFTNPAKRRLYPNWPAVAQNVIAELRAEIEPHYDSPRLTSLLADLRAASPEFRRWWEQHAILCTVDRRKLLDPPSNGPVVLEYTTLRVAVQPRQKLIIYTPVAELEAAQAHALSFGQAT